MTFLTAMVEAIAAAAGQPASEANLRRLRQRLVADEHRARLRRFEQQIDADIEAMKCGPLRVKK